MRFLLIGHFVRLYLGTLMVFLALMSKKSQELFLSRITRSLFFDHIPEENRTCLICGKNEIENELHFILKCPAYTQPRVILRHQVEMGRVYTETPEMLRLLLS